MQKIEHTSHAGIKFELNKKLGYYLVGDNIYYNKIQALIDASKKNLHVRWFFNEDTFIKYPWHIEPEESLRELYCRRAQQLRDTYDYIRIEASGGSDSTTAVYSFLLNGIHLDEVVFRYPKQGEKDVSNNPYDAHCENTLSEWEFAAKPLLEWISTNYPATKITVHDYTDYMLKKMGKQDESWVFETRHYLQPGHAHKHTHTGLIDHQRLADRNYKIGVVYGIDKPIIFIKDSKFFLYFRDSQANHNNPNVGDYTNITNEFFYWSPDCPKLIAKQAHEVKRWFSLPQNQQMQEVLQWPTTNFSKRTLYEQIVKHIVYPDYDFHTFQTVKPTNNIYNEMDYWFHRNFKGTELYGVWKSGITYLLDTLDPKYVGLVLDRPADIQMFNSVYYYFGESDISSPTTNALKTKPLITSQQSDITERKHRFAINGQLIIN